MNNWRDFPLILCALCIDLDKPFRVPRGAEGEAEMLAHHKTAHPDEYKAWVEKEFDRLIDACASARDKYENDRRMDEYPKEENTRALRKADEALVRFCIAHKPLSPG